MRKSKCTDSIKLERVRKREIFTEKKTRHRSQIYIKSYTRYGNSAMTLKTSDIGIIGQGQIIKGYP